MIWSVENLLKIQNLCSLKTGKLKQVYAEGFLIL